MASRTKYEKQLTVYQICLAKSFRMKDVKVV